MMIKMVSSSKSRSSSAAATTSDNKTEEDNASLTGPSSLESFLFLPQLPVDGGDPPPISPQPHASNVHLSSQHNYSFNQEQPEQQKQQQQQQLLFPHSFQNLLSSFRPSSIMGYTNHPRRSSTGAIFTDTFDHCRSNCSSDSCGKLSHHSANDTVIAPHSDSLSGAKSHLSSSMSILIRNAESCNNSEGYNHSPFYAATNHPIQRRSRFFVFRICQALCILLCLLFLLNLVKSFFSNDEYNVQVSSSVPASHPLQLSRQNRLIQSWNMPSIHPPPVSSTPSRFPQIASTYSISNDNDDDHDEAHNLLLLDIPNFTFLLDNKTKCLISSRDSHGNYIGDDNADENTIFFMIIVHSAPQNTLERIAIRETWGSLQRLGQYHVRLVFLLGHDMSSDFDAYHHTHNYSNYKDDSSSFSKILHESQQYGDIVTGNFHDSYRNLTYKHLMGYKWVLSHCAEKTVKFVLKCDDDVFMDIFQLYSFLRRTFGPEDASLICNVFPEGTKPVRRKDTLGKKWAVTYDEYPYEYYPKYCGGLAYLATPNVIHEIYKMSINMHDRYLWIDDVYVTGILRHLAHVEPFYLNLRYSYDAEEYRKWLAIPLNSSSGNERDATIDNSSSTENHYASSQMINEKLRRPSSTAPPPVPPPREKIPFMIVHLERGPDLQKEMRMLWNKTKIVWSKSGLIL